MRRVLLYIALPLAALLLIIFAGLYWLLDTTAGARFALTTLPPFIGINLKLRGLEGTLTDRLHLTGIELKKAKLEAKVDTLDLSWDPRLLPGGRLLVNELSLSGVQVQDNTPLTKKAPQVTWPRVSAAVSRFSADIRKLRVRGLSYRHLQGAPLVVSDLSTSVTFRNGTLSLPDVALVSPQGRAKGELSLGMWQPSLRAGLSAVPAKPVQGMDLFSLQARLLQGKAPELLSGTIAAAGRSGGAQRLELTADLGITQSAFDIRQLTLFRPGRRGTVTGQGRMTLTATEPLFALALQAKDLDLHAELKRPALVNGSIFFSGTPSRYQGSFNLANTGPGWQSASLGAGFAGGLKGVRLSPIRGAVLDGAITGALDVLWSEGTRLRGTLSGRRLNPARVAADWRGIVNLDLAGSFEMPKKGEARGELRGRLLESRLHGQDLKGEVTAAFAGKRLRIDRLFLVGRGFDLSGKGELDRRVDLVARVSDLSRLVPGTAGSLRADAWVRYRDGAVAGAATGEGRNIAAGGARVDAVKLAASLGEGKGYPVHLDATMTGVKAGQAEVESVLMTLNGTAARHVLDARLASSGSEARITLAGGLEKRVWRGELTRFSGHDGVGPWNLAAPAALAIGPAGFRITPLVINGLPGERVELAGAMDWRPVTGEFRGNWTGLNLARADYLLPGTQLSGASSGDVSARIGANERLNLTGRMDGHATIARNGQSVTVERLTANLDGGERGLHAALDLFLEKGSGDAHLLFTSPGPAKLAVPREGDLKLQLANVDLALLRPFIPADTFVVGRVGGVVNGKLLPGKRVDLRGNAAIEVGHIAWRREGAAFDASVSTADVAFNWRGEATGAKAKAGILEMTVRAAADGVYTAKGERIVISRCDLQVDADQHGSRAAFDLVLEQGGTLRAALTSNAPASLGVPETADVTIAWGGLNAKLVQPFLPGLNLQGELGGQARGRIMPGQRLEMTGETEFAQGRARWQGSSGEVNANVRSATLAFTWRGETLSAALDLALAEYGKAHAQFVLPLPARLPVAVNEQGAVQGTAVGRVQEKGFLTAFMPGLVQESHGELNLDLRLAGTWSDPRLTGTMQLSKAGAYLPSAGITVSDVQFTALLQGDTIRIDNFSAVSGKGRLGGNLLVRLSGWEVDRYSGGISGENFQTVYLPELQMVTSPSFTFQGDADTATLNGTVDVPEMLVSGPPPRQGATPSRDVILEGAPAGAPASKKFPILVEGRVHVALGKKVQVKAAGVDAQLGGGMDLVLKGIENISSRGEIRVIKGSYKAYGLDLDIIRGRLYYVDEPVTRPTLDILALRTIGDVKAGVTVGGYLNAPVVKLYSEPAMPEVDILAYMVLGHPLSSTSTDQASMVATAATSLLSFGQSESMQSQIRERLGLSVLGVQTVNEGATGRMGYQQISVTPTGAPNKQITATESLLTVGKYLTPKLYLSYGRSLVTGGSLFMLRYDVTRHWQLETQSGTESGADVYYKLEFD